MPTFGEQLRALRLRRGLVQVDLAARCDVREVTVSRWERDLEFPRGEALKRIAVALNARILIDDSGASIEAALPSPLPGPTPPDVPPEGESPAQVAALAFLLMVARATHSVMAVASNF